MSLSDSPLSTEEPAERSVSVSAESRFAASSNEDDVRVDEGGREHQPRTRRAGLETADDAVLDRDRQRRVDALGGIDHADALDHEAVGVAVASEEHGHDATSIAASVGTATGPCVSRS